MKNRKLDTNLREKIGKDNFYEDVIFKDGEKELKKFVTKWTKQLQEYKKIKIKKFKDLLTPLNEITFPVKISNVYADGILDIVITDYEGKEYYMMQKTLYDYYKVNIYILGRRNSKLEPLIDRDFTFEILTDKINLIETGALKLKEDGTNADEVVNFSYNLENNTTEAELKSYSPNMKMKIKYTTIDAEFDKKVLEFLLGTNKSQCWYYYNVLPVLEWILPNLGEKPSISIIAEVNSEVSAEIEVVEGIVQKYTRTEIISETEMYIIKVIFAKDLKEFIEDGTPYWKSQDAKKKIEKVIKSKSSYVEIDI